MWFEAVNGAKMMPRPLISNHRKAAEFIILLLLIGFLPGVWPPPEDGHNGECGTTLIHDHPDIPEVEAYISARSDAYPIANLSVSPTTVLTDTEVILDAGDSSDPNGVYLEYYYDYGDLSDDDEQWVRDDRVIHRYEDDGQYYVRLKVRDHSDQESEWTEVMITVLNQDPEAHLVPNNTIVDTGSPVLLNGEESNDVDGTIEWYRYRVEAEPVTEWIKVASHEISFDEPGVYLVSLEVKDDDDAVNVSIGMNITVNNRKPVAVAAIDGVEDDRINAQISTMFTGLDSFDPDGDIVEYAWNFDDGVKGSGELASHMYAAPGYYRITLTVTDDHGDEGTCVYPITVLPAKDSDGDEEDSGGLHLSRNAWLIIIGGGSLIIICVVFLVFSIRRRRTVERDIGAALTAGGSPGRTHKEEEAVREKNKELMERYSKRESIRLDAGGDGDGKKKGKSSISVLGDTDEAVFHQPPSVKAKTAPVEKEEPKIRFKSPGEYKKGKGRRAGKKKGGTEGRAGRLSMRKRKERDVKRKKEQKEQKEQKELKEQKEQKETDPEGKGRPEKKGAEIVPKAPFELPSLPKIELDGLASSGGSGRREKGSKKGVKKGVKKEETDEVWDAEAQGDTGDDVHGNGEDFFEIGVDDADVMLLDENGENEVWDSETPTGLEESPSFDFIVDLPPLTDDGGKDEREKERPKRQAMPGKGRILKKKKKKKKKKKLVKRK